MQVIETNDPLEAQRCRGAQYVGIPTAVSLGGSKFVGLVQSVKEEVGPRWSSRLFRNSLKCSHSRGIDHINSRSRSSRGQNCGNAAPRDGLRAEYRTGCESV